MSVSTPSEPKETASKLAARLAGIKVRFRDLGRWNEGTVVGYGDFYETEMVILEPSDLTIGKDVRVAYQIKAGKFYVLPEKRITWVEVDKIEEIALATKKYMPRWPHVCPLCKHEALVMTTSVSCSYGYCKNYDPRG